MLFLSSGSHLVDHSCLKGELMINVVLLQDGVSPWSLEFVKPAVSKAIELNAEINYSTGKLCSCKQQLLCYSNAGHQPF